MARQSPADLHGSVFDLLLDGLADQIAERVIQRLEDYFAARNVVPDAYRVEDAAHALGLSTREVKRRVADGSLGSIKVGRARLIPRDAIGAFLAGRNGPA